MEYLSPQGVLLPLVYGTTASPLWLELRGHSAWQVTPSWTVYRLACHRLLPWLRVTLQPGRARTSGLGVPLLPLARWVGWVAPVRPTHGVLVLSCPSAALRVCSVLGRWAPVHRCARAVCCGASAVSSASWLLFTGVLARCVVLHVRCPGPLGSCSPVCVLCAVRVCHGWLCPSSSPPNFLFFFFVFFLLFFALFFFFFFFFTFFFFYLFFFFFGKEKRKNKKEKNRGARTLQAQARAAGAAVQ